nr:ionotropic receptor 40a-like [Onthophagus taurus]
MDSYFLIQLTQSFTKKDISICHFNVSTVRNLDQYFNYLSIIYKNHMKLYNLFFVNKKLAEHILIEIRETNCIRRNLIYIFYWGNEDFQRYFLRNIHEAMKVVLITNPRLNTYRIYYNQATSHRKHHLSMVNWWTKNKNLFNHPTLPNEKLIFKDFKKKLINVPVIHKPPWHFVKYNNNSIEVIGGRDYKLLNLLSQKLNFRFQYEDPPDRIQGSSFNANGTFEGVLGLIYKRSYEFLLGDVALTLERSNVADFSFLTLADSGAFVTHAPAMLNEALALIRPFHWKVWPAIIITLIVCVVILYVLIEVPNRYRPRKSRRSQNNLFLDSFWFIVRLFLGQSERLNDNSLKVRLFVVLVSLAGTYVIGDMYSANLTSLLAKPGREKSINNLFQLKESMINEYYQLYVEKHSSTFGLLENGSGIYGTLWKLMNENQKSYLIDSVEEGVRLVKQNLNVALIAGRETLFFDIQRFGVTNFHLSDKINTAYSAMAFQIGCPYIENFNKILMAVFEAGILTKLTQDEYEKLGKQHFESHLKKELQLNDDNSVGKKENSLKLKAINIKMLQGAFYLLFIGHFITTLTLIFESIHKKQSKLYKNARKSKLRLKLDKKIHVIVAFFANVRVRIRILIRNYINEAIISTLEYIE